MVKRSISKFLMPVNILKELDSRKLSKVIDANMGEDARETVNAF
jgi:hypothetical protein